MGLGKGSVSKVLTQAEGSEFGSSVLTYRSQVQWQMPAVPVLGRERLQSLGFSGPVC